MIRESVIDAILNRLSAAFGSRLIVHPPASTDEIACLEHLVGTLSREFRILLMTCNGLRIQLPAPARSAEWHLWHVSEMKAGILNTHWPGMPPSVVPFRGDPTVAHDCLIAGPGPAAGAIVRWEPWGQDVELLSSSFGRYLDRWACYLIEKFAAPTGLGIPSKCETFDAKYIQTGDPGLAILREQKTVREWLSGIEHLVGNGDDFE
jgi:hypothetical protein